MVMEDYFDELSEAIRSGNKEEIERVKRKILLASRDESIDMDFIEEIKGKTLYKNLVKFLGGEEFDNYSCAKMITSLITHFIIEAQLKGNKLINYPLSDLYIVLGDFISNPESEKFKDSCKNVLYDRYSGFLELKKVESDE